jgi:hypothetical protein
LPRPRRQPTAARSAVNLKLSHYPSAECRAHYPAASAPDGTAASRRARADWPAMSKKTKKKKLNARRKKANHGKRPNAGRR